MRSALVIDDNHEFASILCYQLKRRGLSVQMAHSGEAGLALAHDARPSLIFLDLRLSDMSGLDVLTRVKGTLPDVEVVIMTAYPELSSALAAIRGKVADYLCKPFAFDELDAVLQRVLDGDGVVRAPRRPAADRGGTTQLVAESAAMQEVIALARRLGTTGVRAVLITGESGTGKELVARLLHTMSPRRDGPFVEVNCSAVSETLFESEFFGHERGAFTGAVGSRRGLAELADGGTLFLDEIGEMPLASQPKLLRFLDDQVFLRVGGEKKIRVDVQIVAATNRELKLMVAQERFRQDLYFRLNVASIVIPPLRERREDVLPTAAYWREDASARYRRRVVGFSAAAEELMLRYDWPGNVRELRNLVERLVLLCPGDRIDASQFPPELRDPGGPSDAGTAPGESSSLADAERTHIHKVLASVGGNKTKAAELLGISRQTLRAKIAEGGAASPAGPSARSGEAPCSRPAPAADPGRRMRERGNPG
jgi:DNA-binding NtrC family response regulator